MDHKPFLDDLPDRKPWAERAIRVLEDHLHFLAERAHLLRPEPVDPLADIGDRPLARNEPQDGKAERRLAGPGFADDAERLAAPKLEGNAVDGFDVVHGAAQDALLDREPDFQVVGLQHHRRGFVYPGRLPFGSASRSRFV